MNQASQRRLRSGWALGLLAASIPCLFSFAHADWHESLSPHFSIKRERVFGIAGLALDLEKVHNRLRMDLSSFSPWMEKERINFYLYGGPRSYKMGEFHPPSWSNGLAFYDRRIVVVYEVPDPIKFNQIVAHELTHLLFESYWAQSNRLPPPWLNEGLAMMEETGPSGEAQESEWFRGMVRMGPQGMLPFDQFLRVNPNVDLQNKDVAGRWYVEAYSVVSFVYREHSRLQFKNFCDQLMNGKSLEGALWTAYRYPRLGKFEKEWKDWIRRKSLGYRALNPGRIDAGGSSASANERPSSNARRQLNTLDSGFKNFSFHNLRGDEN